MKCRTSRNSLTTMLTLAAGACTAVAANPGIIIIDGQGDQASNAESPHDIAGQGFNNRWLDDDTILTNLDIYQNREAIAAMATWIGPGPSNIQPIMADPDAWLETFRKEAAEYFIANRRAFMPDMVLGDDRVPPRRKMIRRSGGASASAVKTGSRGFDIGDPTFNGNEPDNTAHSVNQLWPTIELNGQFVAQIPYSFDEDMIAAWIAADPNEEELNAIAGIGSSLATMLIIEQFAPVQFIGFNPQTDPANGFLLFSNGGDADFDPMTPQGPNTISRIGRPNTANEDLEPTTLTHESWSNFPSIVRSLGFVLGLDWEQRHPDRDTFINIQPQNILPADFPLPIPSLDGNDGPGISTLISPDPGVGVVGGPLLFSDNAVLTSAEDTPGCGFDLDSIMLLRPFALGGSAAYIIRDPFRFVDYSGDGMIDTTPFGEDDRMSSQPPSVFFSACDLAALGQMYSVAFRWYYGLNPNCPHDVNNDGIQGADDVIAFIELWETGDPSADLVAPFGFIDILDLQAFSLGDDAAGIDVFTPGFCNEFGPPGPNFRPDLGNITPPEG